MQDSARNIKITQDSAKITDSTHDSTRKKGSIAENLAREFLSKNGFTIIASNFYTKYGEIDIIAKKGDVWHFVEVKSGNAFNPAQNITEKKLQKIIKSIDFFWQSQSDENQASAEFCIDAIIICRGKIEFFENITA